jgi:hypothetical protein
VIGRSFSFQLSRVADAIERLEPGAVDERAGAIADLLKAGSVADRQRLVRWLTPGKVAVEVR